MNVLNKMMQVTSSNLNLLEEQEHTIFKHLNRMVRNVEMDTLLIENVEENLALIDSLFDEESYSYGDIKIGRVQRQLLSELFIGKETLAKSERKVRECEAKLANLHHQIEECHSFISECETLGKLSEDKFPHEQQESEQEENICYPKDF